MTEEDFVDAEIIHIEIIKDKVGDILWKTKDGRRIRIGDMTDQHIRNCALFLAGFGYDKCIANFEVKMKWMRVFYIEWERRMLSRKAGNKKFRVYAEDMIGLLDD